MAKIKMNVDPHNGFVAQFVHMVQHYNPERYWRYREIVVNPQNKTPRLIKILMLFYIKRSDAFNNASMGTDLNQGAAFSNRPQLPHGLNGIIIHQGSVIGRDCVIYQQVTLGGVREQRPVIGNNVLLGAGCKVLGGVHVGDNVKIGANAVVTKDIPANTTVVCSQMRLIQKTEL